MKMNHSKVEIIYSKNWTPSLLGVYVKNKKELELTYDGEGEYLNFFCTTFNITEPDSVNKKLLSDLVPDLESFWKEFIRSLNIIENKSQMWSLWGVRIKRQCSRVLEVEKIKDFLYGCYNEEYSSLSTGERKVEVIDLDWTLLSNTHYRKAMRLVDNKKAVIIDKYKIQLVHNIITDIYFLPLLRETLFSRQNWKCNSCKKTFLRHLLELHHRFIPQTYKIINKDWNTELVCQDCHRKRHSNRFSLVNILIKFVDLREKYYFIKNKKWKN